MATALVVFAAAPGGAQPARPLVVISVPSAPPGDHAASQYLDRLTRDIVLLLEIEKGSRVDRADFLPANIDFAKALIYYRKVDADVGVYGVLSRIGPAGYRLKLNVWREAKGSRALERISIRVQSLQTGSRAMGTAAQIGSKILQRSLPIGTLQIAGADSLHRFSIYADGQLVGKNIPSVQLPAGKRKIIVARPGALGDQPVGSFSVVIRQNQTTTMNLGPRLNAAATTSKSASQGRKP